MNKLGIQLSVDDFESYRSKMIQAQKLATDTQAAINGMQNPTFGNASKLAAAMQRSFEPLPTAAKSAADQVDAIWRRMTESKRAQDALLATSAKTLADAQIAQANRVAQLMPDLSVRRAEQARVDRSSSALAVLQGREIDSSSGPWSKGEQRYGRINLARQGADVFTQLGSGQGIGITAIQQGPQIVEAMAMSGLKLSSAMAAAAGAAAVGGAAIGAAYLITSKMADVEAKRLKIIEAGVAAYSRMGQLAANSQVEFNRQADKEIEQLRRGDETAAQLRARRDKLQAEINRDQNDPNRTRAHAGYFGDEKQTQEYFDAQNKEMAQLRVDLARAEIRETKEADKVFNQSWEDKKKQIETAAKKAQAFADDVKKGQERLRELGKEWRENFVGQIGKTYGDNPFVKVFTEAQSELEKLRKGLRGLPADMQEAMIASQQLLNSRKLFSARIDNAMDVFDLREMASSFRNAGMKRLTPADVEKMQYQFLSGGTQNIDAYRLNSDRNFLYSGSGAEDFRRLAANNGIMSVGPRFLDTVDGFEGFARRQFDNLDAMGAGSDLNRSALASVLAREKLNPESKFGSPAEKLDRQLAALDRLTPGNAGEQALLDQRILRTASGVNPVDLRADQRERLAQSADRSAEREEKRFQEALTVQKEMAKSLKLLSGEEKKLSDEIAKGGSNALEIRIKDETGSGISIEERRATQEDIDRAFANIYYSGSNRGNR